MFDFLLAPENLPFVVALMLMVMLGAVEAIGLGASAVQMDLHADAHADSDVLAWLGVGRVPVLILLVIFLALFGLIGISLQQLATAFLGAPVSPWLAAPAAALAALPLLGVSARGAARIFPGDETSAVPRDSLVGRRATVTVGVAEVGSPARALVRDVHQQSHYVMVEPTDERTRVPAGQSVLLVRREGDLFIGLAEGEPLSLSLDDRPGLFR